MQNFAHKQISSTILIKALIRPKGQKAKRPKGQKAKRPEGQNGKRPKGQKAKRPKGQKAKRPKGQKAKRPKGQKAIRPKSHCVNNRVALLLTSVSSAVVEQFARKPKVEGSIPATTGSGRVEIAKI